MTAVAMIPKNPVGYTFTQTSVSQAKTFASCGRKWWFEKVKKIPSFQSDHLHYGKSLHSVAERFLLADETGRDADGRPVELFPDGWDSVVEEGVTLYRYTPEQAAWIRRQCEIAIELGIWERRPDAKVEHYFELEVIPGVKAIGYVDYMIPPLEIQDHKTVKTRKYALGKERLSKDVQVLIYGYVMLQANKLGARPAEVLLRHNVFLKTGDVEDSVYKTEVPVPVTQCEEAWAGFQELTRQMLKTSTMVSHRDIPHPGYASCRMYGGCPYLFLCEGRETLDSYLLRLRAQQVASLGRFITPEPGASSMAGPFDNINKGKAALAAKAAAAAGKPPPVVNGAVPKAPTKPVAVAAAKPVIAAAKPAVNQPKPPVAPAAPPATGGAPWFIAGCTACGTSDLPGFNTAGNPCRICVSKCAAAGLPGPDQFIITPFDWQSKGVTAEAAAEDPEIAAAAEEGLPPEEPAAEVLPAVTAPVAPSKAGPGRPKGSVNKPKPMVAPTAPAADDPAAEEPAVEPMTMLEGDTQRGDFVMAIGCFPTRGDDRPVMFLGDLFTQIREQFEAERGVQFFEADGFRRKDLLKQMAPRLAVMLHEQRAVLVCNGASKGSDMGDLQESLEPLAGMVYRAMFG